MKNLRLAFLVPALVAAAPTIAVAAPHAPRALRPAVTASQSARPRVQHEAPIRYVTLDRMIRDFALQAQASLPMPTDRLIAQR